MTEPVPTGTLHGVKGVIFDFDGTLYDKSFFAFYLIAACPLDAVRILKERITRKRFAGRDFSAAEQYYQEFFSVLGKACRKPPNRVKDWFFNCYMPRMVQVLKERHEPRPGAEELFSAFRQTAPPFKAAVYSDYPLLNERMEAIGLHTGKGITLFGPDSFGAQKPSARPFLRIAEELSLAPEEILVAGDRKDTDGAGAANAGMRFFLVKNNRSWNILVKMLLP